VDTLDAPTNSSTTQSDSAYSIPAEAHLLQQVIVHTPGQEMELVAPENRAELLFDDILFLGHARKEHLLMCSIFEKIIGRAEGVLEIEELLLDTFRQEEARHTFVNRLCRSLPEQNLGAVEDELKRFSPSALQRFALTGESDLPIKVQPVPNLMFTRDLAAVVHDHIIPLQAARSARVRESIIVNTVLRHHPRFAPQADNIIDLPDGVTFEGGDLLVASPDTVLIGHSERTSFGAVMAIAYELFEQTPIEHVLAVDLPKRRSTMHLDTVFTFASPEEVIVFPPLLETHGFGYTVHLTPADGPGRFKTDMRPNLRNALDELLDRDLTYIPCGGTERLHQEREQWTDGANVFAPAPGVIVGYERNRRTFDRLQDHGYRVVTAESFLSYYDSGSFTPGSEKVAIQLEGTELSRGRGGPRCMTLPISRHAQPTGPAQSR
jgi:arginine deiminase